MIVLMVVETSRRIYLFTWENNYSLSKELKRRKDMFAEKNGSDSIFSFNRENRDYGQIKQIIFSWWFFVTNKLVILYWMPLDTEKSNSIKADEIEKLSDDIMNNNLPGEVLLICVCYKPDKRGRFYKWFDKLDKENPWQKIIKSFSLLKEQELTGFVLQESKDLWLSSKSVDVLINKVWNDQFRLSSEIDKLRYRKSFYWKEITPEVVNDVCFWMVEGDTFQLLDLILTNPESSVEYIQRLQDDWIDWNALNWSFAWWLRNYLFVLDYADCWITDSKLIAWELKQNPRAISNIIKKLPLLKEKRDVIYKLFKCIVDIDYDIKSGNAYPENYFFSIKKVLLKK